MLSFGWLLLELGYGSLDRVLAILEHAAKVL